MEGFDRIDINTPVVPATPAGRGRSRRALVAAAGMALAGGVAGGVAAGATIVLGRGWLTGTTNSLPGPGRAGQPAASGSTPAVMGPIPAAPTLAALYRSAAPAVVGVQVSAATGRSGSPDVPGGGPAPRGQGSGVIVDAEGYVITNNHVVEGASRVTLTLIDGTRVPAQVAGTDPVNDLALLKADLPAGRTAVAVLGDSDTVQPGERAIAIGSPFGLHQSITAGVVSAINREMGGGRGRTLRGLIQTDTPINPGNSGGPLFNAYGEVIGINTGMESPIQGSVGVGFAVPINAARRLFTRVTGRTLPPPPSKDPAL